MKAVVAVSEPIAVRHGERPNVDQMPLGTPTVWAKIGPCPKAGQMKRCNTMAWESRNGRGSYYTRTKRSGGQVVREYVGSGAFAHAIAAMDAAECRQRQAEADAQRETRIAIDAIDAQVTQLDDFADVVARAFLVAAGYHQHNRGGWRKRRGKEND